MFLKAATEVRLVNWFSGRQLLDGSFISACLGIRNGACSSFEYISVLILSVSQPDELVVVRLKQTSATDNNTSKFDH